MFYKVTILIALLAATVLAKDCLRCICEAESGCKALPCKKDVNSLSCGYYQIKLPYYKDCGAVGRKKGEDIEKAWQRCALDYDCATKCVKKYMQRYLGECKNVKGNCQKMARLHNGGPNGCNIGGTVGYWKKVQKCCNCN